MNNRSDFYEDEYVKWFEKWEQTPRWRWYKRAIAFGRWKFYLELMMDEIRIENYERT